MKNYKFYQICYTVNFIIFLIIICIRAYIEFIKSDFTMSALPSFIIVFIILSLFSIFDWFCHQLLHSIKNDIPLSDISISRGTNYKNICLLISVLFSLAMILKIKSSVFEVNSWLFNIREYYLWYCFFSVFITTLYLCIGYGSMLKHQRISLTKTIEKIGTGN